ncbi:SDR family oxidoreductase [Methylococcus capsulatus]|jgi:NAD(P)-dependent dehydrogenase (short-subunit alcohol dehydrogenase family)|uniref:SDR family oxidoreductase n=1 Tax=Methylococcus capsulatus TaxID=414 RepID=UPI001C52E456|nr:SDR family oxidoreductase [Methylococcus capsulatus]QXP87218.1 SDR family oxidoreductase [Methylococcus capsulatus]QXP93102.1 SDR family oxidoreductase [Methylococcus capsulatus]UQN12213.1 SDR family oxidoreductase [Methylococcus capsulatus]
MQDRSQSPRTILITGCSSGIGLCTALGLKARGYRVFASARKTADVALLQAKGLEAVQLDLACSTSVHTAFEEVLESTGGKLYALFNNGAFGQPGAVEDLSREVLRAQFETNLFGTHELTRLVIPIMRRQGEGRILQNSSVLGFAAMPWRGAYNASKFALEGLTDTLRMELAGSGIHVCLIEPGPIASEFRAHAHDLYKRNIDAEASVHRERYRTMEARLEEGGAATPFTAGPEAVLKRVIHALESRRPKARYYVTFPTYLFAMLKRVLPTRALDAILRRID